MVKRRYRDNSGIRGGETKGERIEGIAGRVTKRDRKWG